MLPVACAVFQLYNVLIMDVKLVFFSNSNFVCEIRVRIQIRFVVPTVVVRRCNENAVLINNLDDAYNAADSVQAGFPQTWKTWNCQGIL